MPEPPSKFIRTVGHIWRIAVGIISLVIMVGLLDSFRDKFQVTVIAGLGLIYVSVHSVSIGLQLMYVRMMSGLISGFTPINTLLDETSARRSAEMKAVVSAIEGTAQTNLYINGFFLALNALLCGIALVGPLLK